MELVYESNPVFICQTLSIIPTLSLEDKILGTEDRYHEEEGRLSVIPYQNYEREISSGLACIFSQLSAVLKTFRFH